MITYYGLWDQLQLDKGKKWTFAMFVQERLSQFQNNTSCNPCVSASSKQVRQQKCLDKTNTIILLFQNHTIERLWVEVNSRINYRIKALAFFKSTIQSYFIYAPLLFHYVL